MRPISINEEGGTIVEMTSDRKWISLTEDLEHELEASRLLVEKQKNELDTKRKFSKELKDAMEMAMEGHARMLEQDTVEAIQAAGELLVRLKEAVAVAEVIMRMRPISRNEEGGTIVEKTSGDTLSIQGQKFTFDSMDIFELVGASLVENCLAGFNSYIFAYGYSRSENTYTIWGPTNALLEDKSSSNEKGLTPRVFE
nr:kinesin-like protein KIN-12B [Tanacetum cinerariifolium]